MSNHTKLRPTLDGPWWLIGPSPDFTGKLDGEAAHRTAFDKGTISEHNAPVDHHIVRDRYGTFHLWGCVRGTAVGRVLYHWETDDITESPWLDTGQFIRADTTVGESIDDWFGQEWLQSPYFVKLADRYYMFYGGHRAGLNAFGNRTGASISDPHGHPDDSLHQICLMISTDGKSWIRHKNADGASRLFLGPGETRDPCLIEIDGLWHMYYAGYFDFNKPEEGAGFVVRTSTDLITWSDWRLVHRDPTYGVGRTETECPFVIYKAGYYYLFRTVGYYNALTLVFRSEDPYDFGIGDASTKLVGRIPCAAPEIYTFDGQEYLSSSHTPLMGEMMCRLKWVDDE